MMKEYLDQVLKWTEVNDHRIVKLIRKFSKAWSEEQLRVFRPYLPGGTSE